MNQKQRRTYWTKSERMRLKIEGKYRPRIQKALDAQAADLAALVNARGPQAANQVDIAPWDQALYEVYEAMFTEAFLTFARATYYTVKRDEAKSGTGPGMGRADTWTLYVQDWLRREGLKLVVTITGNSRELYLAIANKAIQDGIDQGLGAREIQTLITRRLADQNYTYSGYRALRIARTETIRAANEGHMEGAKALPFYADKIWISAQDTRTRRIPQDEWDHFVLDGQRTELDKPFLVNSREGLQIEVQQPGDVTAPPGFTINCRCRVAFQGKRGSDGRLLMKPQGGQAPTAQPGTPPVLLVPTGSAPKPKPKPKPTPKPKVEKFEPDPKDADKTAEKLKDWILKYGNYKGINGKITRHPDMKVEDFNRRAKVTAKLFQEYQPDLKTTLRSEPKIVYEGTDRSYGFVRSYTSPYIKNDEINFGHRSDSGIGRIYKTGQLRGKSAVDQDNLPDATIVHEFAHVMSTTNPNAIDPQPPAIKAYWDTLAKIKREYRKEILAIRKDTKLDYREKIEKINEIHLGDYADTNLDEFHAEAWTEYYLRTKPSKYALKVGKLIDKTFKRK